MTANEGLYDPSFEHDACGVGMVVDVHGQRSHSILRDALTILENLTHRGGKGVDVDSGDGAGVLLQVPDRILRDEFGAALPPLGAYGLAMCFLPVDRADEARARIGAVTEGSVLRVIGWRRVPIDVDACGPSARASLPAIAQLVLAPTGRTLSSDELERALYLFRRRVERDLRAEFQGLYICSCSSRTVVYKGLLLPSRLPRFFRDLGDPRARTAVAIVHQRFSTNTFPAWERAHPYRLVAHNGEINALRGNINAMRAREATLPDELRALGPVIETDTSDSGMFDNVLELLVRGGRSLAHGVGMMMPEAWEQDALASRPRRDFFAWHASVMEPWDGPAAMVFTDGVVAGAALDRNGLRPMRVTRTIDGRVIVASESGALPLSQSAVLSRDRLSPGRMLLVDTARGMVLDDDGAKNALASAQPYGAWLASLTPLSSIDPSRAGSPVAHSSMPLATRHVAHGYTLEDPRIVLAPMASAGEEPVGSMGNDTPLAALSEQPQLLFDYFRQLFAQVTNPPIDSLRESLVMSLRTTLGAEGPLLASGPLHARQLVLDHVVLASDELARIVAVDRPGLRAVTLAALVSSPCTHVSLEGALTALCDASAAAVTGGATILVLSDRTHRRTHAPVPTLLATAAVHHHLLREGLRTRCSLVIDASDAREVMHFCLLLAYGASAVHPSLAIDSVAALADDGSVAGTRGEAIAHYLKAANKGVAKVMSKMGISTVQSYRGAQLVEALGLSHALIDAYFPGTTLRPGTIDLAHVADATEARHTRAHRVALPTVDTLDRGGRYQWRRDSEDHLYDPDSIGLLQHAVRAGRYELFKKFSARAHERDRRTHTIRGRLTFTAGTPVPIEQVESVGAIVQRFKTGAMSFGSISREAHETLAIAMNRMGARSNSGEGGEDAARFIPDANGDLRRSAIKQVASARFGVTSHYLVNADELQIKMAQGAKPGEGGQLPGHKVDDVIARLRHATAGVGLISPPPHHDIYSIEDLAQLIFDLRAANDRADVSVKLVAEAGVGTVAAGVAKAGADKVLVSGDAGGTGAAPLGSIRNAGIAWEIGLAEAQQVLVRNDLRGRVRLETDGQLKTGRDVAVAALLGAEEFGFATAALVASGCVLMRVCHLNTCPVGIATQDPVLRARFTGEPEHVVNFMRFVAEELRELMASLGFRTVDEMVGRVDRLRVDDSLPPSALDLDALLYDPARAFPGRALRYTKAPREHGAPSLDTTLLAQIEPALADGVAMVIERRVRNTDRAIGTRISAEVSRRHGAAGLPDDRIVLRLEGTAGQSLGAFLAHGVTVRLEGDANDHVGKGLSGGRVVIVPARAAHQLSDRNVALGNVALYGATSGELFARGRAGERFGVRNSGATAVVEGVGDHGCEYMTGGTVAVLGGTGRNFAAGMSGGIAYVEDVDGHFADRCNMQMVALEPLAHDDDEALRALLQRHVDHTGSPRAREMLTWWNDARRRFVKVVPHEYRRAMAKARTSAVPAEVR